MQTNKDLVSSQISTVLESMFYAALNSYLQGDSSLARELGLEPEILNDLESLNGYQVKNIALKYAMTSDLKEFISIDVNNLSSLVKIAKREMGENELSDEFIKLGAHKPMLMELFGLKSKQIARRKEILRINTPKGRKCHANKEDQLRIYNAWLDSIQMEYRERFLFVAKKTKISLALIYNVVKQIETNDAFYEELITDCCR